LWRGAALSFLMAVVPFLLLALALRHVPTGTAAILNATAPLWAAAYLLAIAGAGRHPETSCREAGSRGSSSGCSAWPCAWAPPPAAPAARR
jgi:hypothetical protein